ncbi:MarR family winged helix-turn-helix transcriptional regulator [Saccharothrix coeruleofusca]|uniref:HTH marR-type domain-containing protein n=1 Tax=Saccharothrix coeruleofusca TaxID=33919 RepID=A0A918AH67_9PSEU|nr:MarR family transcriptional regulator [Saccharothrix coeruleofusca]MBP2340350.1 DNA-binding MarR family transcriptional regulator [Saccharothrix coeruleofusca]GGP35915.1 hypothetical protein GCM10010185_03620 [Saccharothrix coeruleofusca]
MTTEPDDGAPASEEALADRVGHALARLNRLQACLHSQMSKAGIDKASFILLATLHYQGPSRSSALAEAVFSDPSTVSRQVADLVKEGLVERRADPADGRASVLVVTEAGVAFLDERRRGRNAAIARLFADWSTPEWAEFATYFERFVGDYERALPNFIPERGSRPRPEGENN